MPIVDEAILCKFRRVAWPSAPSSAVYARKRQGNVSWQAEELHCRVPQEALARFEPGFVVSAQIGGHHGMGP
eukprot:323323-Prymnesium_polylepis.1